MNNLICKLGALLAVGIDVITAFVPLVKIGQLKALAVTSANWSPLLPEARATAKISYSQLRIDNYFDVFGPAGLPKGVVNKLYTSLIKVLTMPNMLKKLEADGTVRSQILQTEYAALVTSRIAN